MDMLILLANVFLLPYTSFVLKEFIATSLFLERKNKRKSDEQGDIAEEIKADFANRNVVKKQRISTILKCKGRAYMA